LVEGGRHGIRAYGQGEADRAGHRPQRFRRAAWRIARLLVARRARAGKAAARRACRARRRDPGRSHGRPVRRGGAPATRHAKRPQAGGASVSTLAPAGPPMSNRGTPDMQLPPRSFHSLTEIAIRWSVTPFDVIGWSTDGLL